MIRLPDNFLRGSYPPLVTPLRDGGVDYETFARLVEHQVREGSHGIVVCGTTGEPSMLTTSERMQLLEVAIETAKGRLPVVAATGSQSHEETVALTAHADTAGADAVLIVTPYYSKPPQRGLVEYYIDLGDRTRLPLLIYHIPGRAAVEVQLDTIERIAERVPHLVGIKHAVNDLAFVTRLLARFGFGFRVFVGLEELSLPMLAVGAAGMMNAVGNLAPRRVAEMYASVARGDLAAARQLHFELFELNQAIFFDTNPIPLKYMMKRVGLLARNEHRLPMVSATTELQTRLDAVLGRAGLIGDLAE
ncbi:MAG TPA: 4-hydroxy-tetrahydrodipicolinate synthase [Candidatus Binatia bacterium]|nr:4-hydroxy-tetrahydrodipicolinate synthase [Candidatus Binatia bacterium]